MLPVQLILTSISNEVESFTFGVDSGNRVQGQIQMCKFVRK
jgi:hypothetical protein